MADVDPTKLQRAAELGLVSPEIASSFRSRMGDPSLLMGKAPVNASVMPDQAAEPQVTPVSLRAQEEVVPAGALAGDALPQADTRQMASMSGAPDLGLSGAFAQQKRGVDVVAKAGEQQLSEQAKAIDTAQREAKRLADAQLVEQAEQEKRQAEELQKLKDLQTQYSTAKVDPKRLWSNMSTGDKILAGISMAFGALGAGSNGGVNTAVKVIESAIDRDLKLQEDEIGRKRDAVTVQSGIIAEMRQQFKDKDLANTAARMAIMEQMKLQVDGIAAKFGSQKVKGEAMQLRGALDQKLAEAQATFQKQYASVAAAQRLAGGKASAA
jgi:ribosome biogenesis SPOUT family RNA methylase Rps3